MEFAMPYVIKDRAGKIVFLYDDVQERDSVWLEEDDPSVEQFRKNLGNDENKAKTILETSDLELIRVIEDLTELLIDKQVFAFTELPLFAQQKLGNRQKIRKDMISLKSLVNDENDEGIF